MGHIIDNNATSQDKHFRKAFIIIIVNIRWRKTMDIKMWMWKGANGKSG